MSPIFATVVCSALAAVLNGIWLWAGDRLSVSAQLAVPAVSVALVWLGMRAHMAGLDAAGRNACRRRALTALLIYYLAILAVVLFFGGLFHLDRAWGGPVNLRPLATVRRFWRHYRRTQSRSSLYNLVGNAVLLLPLGVLLPVLYRPMRRPWYFLPLAAAVAAGIEYLQWRTGLGVADVDDSILNFAGAVAGYLVTCLCILCVSAIRRFRK